MNYNEYLPNSKFRKYIECFWTLKGTLNSTDFIQEPLVPGGRSEIIFTSSSFLWYGKDKHSTPRLICEPFLLGPREFANFIGLKGDYCCVGIRFKIGSLSLFTNKSSHIFSNKVLLLNEVFEEHQYPHDLISTNVFSEVVHLIENWLEQIFTTPDANWEIVQELIRLYMSRCEEKIIIKELSQKYAWNYKKTERMFLKYAGLTPRSVIRILRFRSFMEKLNSKPENLTSSAYQFGFYDQSHLIKEFYNFTGSTPSAFYKNLPEISALLYNLT